MTTARRAALVLDRLGPHARPLAVVVAAFVLSRAVVYALGVRFDISPLYDFLQFADPELLHHRLLETVWHLHIQPPLYNLLVGAMLKAFPGHFAGAMHVVYLLIGLIGAVAGYRLLAGLGFRARSATAIAVLLTVAPFSLVYENWLYYEYPVMVLLLVLGVAVLRFADGWRFLPGLWLFTLVAVCVFTRQVFQFPWVLALVVLLAVLSRRPRTVLLAAALPLVVIALLYAKNIALFGVPSTSSWFGMNMARITLNVQPRATLERLVRDGTLGPLALVPPLSPLADFGPLVPATAPTGIPVLDRPLKPNGAVNLNAKPFIRISEQYATESLKMVRAHPQGYLKGIAMASGKLSVPATDFSYVYPQRNAIRWWDRLFNLLVYLRLPGLHGIGWLLPVLYALACLVGLKALLRGWRGRRSQAVAPVDAALLVLGLTVAYFLAIAALLDYGENQRVHSLIDAVVLVLAAVGLRGPAARACARLSWLPVSGARLRAAAARGSRRSAAR